MKIDLSGTTALVTGSTGGIGLAIAKGLADAGGTQACREHARGARDLGIGVPANPIPVVVDEKVAAMRVEVAEEVDERLASHLPAL